jgi:DNA repair exonuclease SbcCD nuclease subunit
MKIAILNDTHCGIRNSSDIFMEYQEKFYRDIFFPYLLENNIKKILHLGDYYDNRKFINFKSLEHNRKIFLEKLREHRIHMDIIPGNHDVYYKNTNKLNSLKELLGHYMAEVRIIDEPTVVNYDGLDVALIPWINPENEHHSLEFITKCKASIVAAHLELAGFEMQMGVPCTDGMDMSLFERFEMVLSGHFHTKSQRANIHYLGSQMEFFWSDLDDAKYFHVLDTGKREITPISNPMRLHTRIFYDDMNSDTHFKYSNGDLAYVDEKFVKIVVVNKTNPKLFEKFVDRVQKRNIYDLKISETFSEFVGKNVDDDQISVESTENLLYSYIDAVDTVLDRDKIKNLMHQLMIEAQTLEVA